MMRRRKRMMMMMINNKGLRTSSAKKQLYLLGGIAIFVLTWFSYSTLESLTDKSNRISAMERFRKFQQSTKDVDVFSPMLTSPDKSENISCKPKQNIFFLKTHKCASSTVQNIFLRYAERNMLNLVLPLDGTNYLGHPGPFSRSMIIPIGQGESYNIFCHHTRFSPPDVAAIMPQDTVYVTIIRDPVDLFESLYSYYDLHDKWGVELTSLPPKDGHSLPRSYGKFGRNQMLFDLGFKSRNFDKPDAVDRFIDKMDTKFNLVMVAERFDESLILLKHLLCWRTEDMLYFKQNARADDLRRDVDDAVRNRLRQWNAGDQKLYEHFSNKFQKEVEKFGVDRMKAEVAELRAWNDAWYEHCVDRTASANELEPQFRSWSGKVIGFHLRANVRSRLCESMAKAEIAYTMELRREQRLRHANSIWQWMLALVLG